MKIIAHDLALELRHEEKLYGQLRELESSILNTSLPGFSAACKRVRLVGQQQALAEKIRRNKLKLRWAQG